MLKIWMRSIVVLLLVMFVWACSSNENKDLELKEAPNAENLADNTPEEIKGRIDVYNSMARTVKYNSTVATQNMKSKITYKNQNISGRDLIGGVLNVNSENANQFYDALRVLDYAVIFATDNMQEDAQLQEDYVYVQTSAHLALAAIKAHQDALFAMKKVNEIDRESKKEQKILDGIGERLARSGNLSNDEIEYKKGLEVSLVEKIKLRNLLAANVAQYAQVAKIDNKDFNLEGRRFYELDDFDKDFSLESFQKTAAANRIELSYARKWGTNTDYAEIQRNLIKDYPEMERLQLNGYDVKDPIYAEQLVKRSLRIAENLLDAVLAYKRESVPNNRRYLKEQALELLGEAIFMQVEMAYNLVAIADLDLKAANDSISKIQKDIREREKDYRAGYKDRLEVQNLKLKLLEAEIKVSQTLGERAVALRSLYFYAGFSPFNRVLLKEPIKVIVENLRLAFNRDLVDMLANSKQKDKEEFKNPDENWSKGDDWLERVMEPKKTAIMSKQDKNSQEVSAKAEVTPDQKKILQLGSYIKKENADIEWEMLKQLYPELANMQPKIERVNVNGQRYYRLLLRSEVGGFANLCAKLQKDSFECVLR